MKLHIKQEITKIAFKEEWQNMSLVIYPAGLGMVRDLIGLLPLIKRLNLKFFLDGAKKENYDAVQILSSLGIYSGILINENADWEKLTDLMYYALCGRVAHAPIEPFQYVFDTYQHNRLVDYGVVYLEKEDLTTRGTIFSPFGGGRGRFNRNLLPLPPPKGEMEGAQFLKAWQRFFLEPTPCAACAGWRICMGKYAGLVDKTGCRNFTMELLTTIENIKFKK